MWPKDLCCTKLLLENNADVNHKDMYGNTLLHYANWFNPDPRHARLMIAAMADINARSFTGNKTSPLHLACWHGQVLTAASLIKAGAVLSIDDTINMLSLSVEEDLRRTRALIPVRFDCSGSDLDGDTVPHAAVHGEEDHLDVLTELNIPELNPAKRNVNSFKPIELLEMRAEASSIDLV